MSVVFQALSVVAMALFTYFILTKLGLPVFLAAIAAVVAGFVIWQFEQREKEDEPRWASVLESVFDLRDIFKYVNKIF